ncbi:MAG: hypothetical protein JO170_26930 [Verrucomicrobia bacterium]|nr:hypothetical protein [Verrucomicrobiota bacterium]
MPIPDESVPLDPETTVVDEYFQVNDREPICVLTDTADPLLNPHRIPGQILLQHMTELKVNAFATDFRGDQHTKPLPVPNDVERPAGQGAVLFRRFSVAYGLSFLRDRCAHPALSR